MSRSVVFRVPIESFDMDLHIALRDARAAVEKAQKDLIRKFSDSDRFQAACDVAGYGQAIRKTTPQVRVDNNHLVVSLLLDEVGGSQPAPYPVVHIDPKLVNTLLHGKILTDAEKRALVSALVPSLKMMEARA